MRVLQVTQHLGGNFQTCLRCQAGQSETGGWTRKADMKTDENDPGSFKGLLIMQN